METNACVNKRDTAEALGNQEDIYVYLQAAFENGDPRQIAKALGDVAKIHGMLEIAGKSGMTREHLYTSLSESGNPTLQTLTKVIDALGYRLSVVPKANRNHMA